MARWLSLGKVLPWLAKRRARVILYLDEKNPDFRPTVSWWISFHALICHTDETTFLFMYLQYKRLLVFQLCKAFDQFIVRRESLQSQFPKLCEYWVVSFHNIFCNQQSFVLHIITFIA
jgi:hypothetical protein